MSINFFKHNIPNTIKISLCENEVVTSVCNFVIPSFLINYKIINR